MYISIYRAREDEKTDVKAYNSLGDVTMWQTI